MLLNKPIKLSRAGAWRTYLGGSLIEKLHGNLGSPDSNFPEEWILSTVRARNSGRENIVEGLSMIDGTDISLSELIEQDPEAALGTLHTKVFGNSPGVLVKLLDAAERLTIQVYPSKEKAAELFDSPFGKNECWHIIGGRDINGEKPCIYLGFVRGITRDYWKSVFERQDIQAMLACLNRIEVKEGDTYLIEGGVPHAIGAGCFLIEIQEPTDLTIRTERVTPSGFAVDDLMCHQGLGFERMFDCFDYNGCDKQEIRDRCKIRLRGNSIISYDDTKMFRLNCFENTNTVVRPDGVFSGIYILSGIGTLDGVPVKAGDQFFVPAVCEPFEVVGNVRFIRFFGPYSE